MPDDHDLYSFEVFEVNPPPKKGVGDMEMLSCFQSGVDADLRFTKPGLVIHLNRRT
jgi:hypothetical protein